MRDRTVIPDDALPDSLVDDLMGKYSTTSRREAYDSGLAELRQHFEQKDSRLPFDCDLSTKEFRTTDPSYISFIAAVANKRGNGGDDAREFEVKTADRLARRVTGAVYRVGAPRKRLARKREFVPYLQALGFDRNCLEARDRDGGLDILWLPPLGTVPLRALVSVQCKNSLFDEADASRSVARAKRTFQRHSNVRGSNHLYFVVFNDYIDKRYVGRACGWTFIPLGLSDLSANGAAITSEIL